MDERLPRKRIPIVKTVTPAIVDPLEFKKNKSSDKARVITSVNESIAIGLWFDKHYVDRLQHGDDDGKRDGIEIQDVKKLILQSVKHLLFYSACLKNFIFLNHEEISNGERAIRIVCQQNINEGMLNVPIEVHYKSLKMYEITVKTAMRNNDFSIGDNQYALEIIDNDSSVLRRMVNKKLVEVCSI